MTYGSKASVYHGNADMTRGGLTKKDIGKRTDKYGNVRYYSKHQRAQGRKLIKKNPWHVAVQKAKRELKKEGEIPKDLGFVPLLKRYKPGLKYPNGKAIKKETQMYGVKIYKRAKELM